MATHARQSSRLLASAVAAGALAAAGAALVAAQPCSPIQARVVSMPVVLVDHSCAATDIVCDLAASAPGVDGVFVPAAIRPAFISPVASLAPAPAALTGPIDPILARLLGAPAQILANPFNVIGRGGWLIGDAVTPGANGGLLIGNGAGGRTPGQNGGLGGLLIGAGGNGANGGIGQDGGNGGAGGLFIGNGGHGGNGGAADPLTGIAGNGGSGGNASRGTGGDGGNGGNAGSIRIVDDQRVDNSIAVAATGGNGGAGGYSSWGDGGSGGNGGSAATTVGDATAGDGGYGGSGGNGGDGGDGSHSVASGAGNAFGGNGGNGGNVGPDGEFGGNGGDANA